MNSTSRVSISFSVNSKILVNTFDKYGNMVPHKAIKHWDDEILNMLYQYIKRDRTRFIPYNPILLGLDDLTHSFMTPEFGLIKIINENFLFQSKKHALKGTLLVNYLFELNTDHTFTDSDIETLIYHAFNSTYAIEPTGIICWDIFSKAPGEINNTDKFFEFKVLEVPQNILYTVYNYDANADYEFRNACMAPKNTNLDISWKFDDDKDKQSAFRIACEQK